MSILKRRLMVTAAGAAMVVAGIGLGAPAQALDRSVVAPRAMVVAGHPLAVASGMKALRDGGTACDAFVATAATLSIPLTDMMGPLGSGYALVHMAGGKEPVRAIDYNGVAPAATDPAKFTSQEDKRRGILAGTVPGAIKGWEEVHRTCGKLPWADLWEDAIYYAENGWAIDADTAAIINRHIPEIGINQTWADEFLNNGGEVKAGYLLKRPDLAKSYRQFAELGSDALYKGPIGEKLVAFMEKEGGLITQEDLTNYSVKWVDPITVDYRGYKIYGAPPSSSSITWMEILNIVEGYDLKAMGHNTPDYLRVFIEATKHAYQHAYQYVGDPAFVDVPVDKLLSDESATEIRASIDKDGIRPFAPMDVASIYQPAWPNHSTSHMVIRDEAGNAVSSTNTLGTFFGSGMVVEGTGLLPSNGMDWFDIDTNIWTGESPGVLGMEPGKRNRWTLAPGMVFEDDKLFMLVGGAGAEATMWGIAQPIVNVIDFGMEPQAALDAPRFRYGDIYHYTGGTAVGLEPGIADETRAALTGLGYQIDEVGRFSNSSRGTTQMMVIDKESGALWGGAAPNGRDFLSGY
jgi:gamma-glutamyltranspeptidase